MRPLLITIAIALCAFVLLGPIVYSEGTGVKVFAPSQSSISVDTPPLLYNGTFIVQNDGLREGVYVIRVSVDDPAAMGWINITPSGFVLAPGELKVVNYSIGIPDQANPGSYHFIFMPALLPWAVEPYLDTFANYVTLIDKFNFTVDVLPGPGTAAIESAPGKTPVVFSDDPGKVNLIQYAQPATDDRIVTQIDRAVRINAPAVAPVNQPVPVSLSVFQDLNPLGIELMAVSPDGDFFPITEGNFTFGRTGRWGIIALVGNDILLGRPVDIGEGGAQLVMPGLDTILASLSLLLLLAVVPIWFLGRTVTIKDPYEDVAYKAYIVKKYIDQFDARRLRHAVDMLSREYDELLAKGAKGNSELAKSSLDELRTLAQLESDY